MSEIRLGLRANLPQFGLLVVLNAFVGAMAGLERTVLPLLGEQEFGLSSKTGLNYTSTIPPTTSLTADIFGRYSVGELMGWISFSHQVGAALGAALAGWVFEWTGSYSGAFVSAAILGLRGLGARARDSRGADYLATDTGFCTRLVRPPRRRPRERLTGDAKRFSVGRCWIVLGPR